MCTSASSQPLVFAITDRTLFDGMGGGHAQTVLSSRGQSTGLSSSCGTARDPLPCHRIVSCPDAYWHQLERVVRSGVDAVVLREKDLLAGEYRQMAQRFVTLCDAAGCTPVLHGHPELCVELGVRWVHLPLPQVREVDSAVLAWLKVGVSVHSVAEAQEALALLADLGMKPAYLFVSNIFETDCKPGLEGKGLELLQSAREIAEDVPLIALGGITADNAAQTLAAGADGVALRSGFMHAEDPMALVRTLRG